MTHTQSLPFSGAEKVSGSIAGDGKLQEYLSRAEHHARDQARLAEQREEKKAADRKQKEMETKAYLDRQVEAKREKKEQEKYKEHALAEKVHADVQAFEKSKRDHQIQHQNKMHSHLDGLLRQIEDGKGVSKKAPHVAKIGLSIAEHELLINKKLIEDVENGEGFPGSPQTIKRPF